MKKSVIYKFILLRTRELICDDMTRPRFMASFDRIVNDLYGVPKFSRKIANSYDNRDICAIIDLVGVDNLIKIYNNNYYYAAISELIMVDYQTRLTCKELNKHKKNNNQRKSLMKKKNYLIDLYRKALKQLRKALGIKNAETAYKRNFQILNGLVKQRDYDEFGFDLDFDDPYDDDYVFGNSFGGGFESRFNDDYDSTSPLEDFVREMNGTQPRHVQQPVQEKLGGRFRKATINDFDFDPYDDYDPSGSYPDIERESDEEEDRIDRLTATVSDLSSVVNALVNQKEYDIANPQRGPRTLDEVDAMYDSQYEESDDPEWKDSIINSLKAVDENQKMLAGALGNIMNWKGEIDDMLRNIIEMHYDDSDDLIEDDEPKVIYGNPEVLPQEETREAMIDQINHSEVPVAGAPVD